MGNEQIFQKKSMQTAKLDCEIPTVRGHCGICAARREFKARLNMWKPLCYYLLDVAVVSLLSLAVSEGDALHGHLEVDSGGRWEWVGCQCLTNGLGNGLRPRE